MTTTSTIHSARGIDIAEGPARRERHEDAVRPGVDAFAAMLDATRQTVQARTLATTRESPAQMFEAKGETEPRQPKDESTEPVNASNNTPPAAQKSPANGTPSWTDADAAAAGSPQGDAPLAALPSQPSTTQTPASAIATTPDPAVASTVDSETSPDDAESGFTRREQDAVGLKSETSVPTRAELIATNGTPTVQNAMPPAGREARLAQTVGEALGAKGLEPMAGARGANAAGSVPSGRPTANTANRFKLDSSAAGEALKSPPAESDNDVTPFERLVRSLRMQVGERYSTARMRLNPPELGEMRVDVHLRGDEVELEVRTMDEAARRIVVGRAEELRSALEQGGVTVRRFDVMVDETMVAALPRFNHGSRAAGTPKGKSDEAERESADRAGVRRALSRRGRLDVRG